MIQSSNRKYSKVAIPLHWMIAILIIGMLAMGWYLTSLPKGTPGVSGWFDLHKSFGIVTLLLVAFRIIWRVGHKPPAQISTLPRWMHAASHLAHLLLYLVMTMMPLSGFLGSVFGRPIILFGMPLPRLAEPNKSLNHLLFNIHSAVAWVIAIIVGIHIIAALYHRIVMKDGVLQRMLPGGQSA